VMHACVLNIYLDSTKCIVYFSSNHCSIQLAVKHEHINRASQ
jgi:hypothetical protein